VSISKGSMYSVPDASLRRNLQTRPKLFVEPANNNQPWIVSFGAIFLSRVTSDKLTKSMRIALWSPSPTAYSLDSYPTDTGSGTALCHLPVASAVSTEYDSTINGKGLRLVSLTNIDSATGNPSGTPSRPVLTHQKSEESRDPVNRVVHVMENAARSLGCGRYSKYKSTIANKAKAAMTTRAQFRENRSDLLRLISAWFVVTDILAINLGAKASQIA
jgi:hypothetical protein